MKHPASLDFLITTVAATILELPHATAQVSRYRGPGDLSVPEGRVPHPPKGPRWSVRHFNHLDTWQSWWEFNRDRFTHARTRSAALTDVDTILVGLKRALDRSRDRILSSSCLLALGSLGRDHPDFEVVPLLVEHLRHRDAQVAEAAALALGISRLPGAVPALLHLARDTKAGRRMVDRRRVGYRTRAAALYGLGLVGGGRQDADVKRRAFAGLRGVLREPGTLDARELRNLRTAAIHGISLLGDPDRNPERGRATGDRALEAEMFFTLDEFEHRDHEPKTERTLSHVPPAIASVLGRGCTPRHAAYKARLRQRLKRGRSRCPESQRSAALALGKLAVPGERDPSDAVSSEALVECYRTGRDAQARYFSLIALGQIGGDANRARLTRALTTGNKALERPWAAIGLGLLEYHRRERDPDADIRATGELLVKQLRDVKNPDSRAAFAVAMGLCRYEPASGQLSGMLVKDRHQNVLAGYLCVSLALLDARTARNTVLEIVRQSARRPHLMLQAAPSLARLGHPDAFDTLVRRLDVSCAPRLSGLAEGLSESRERHHGAALTRLLADEKLRPVERARVAAALGRMGRRDPMPWNARLTADVNYRATTEVMIGQGVGVFERF